MKSRWLRRVLIVLLVVLGVVYVGGSWFFGDLIVAAPKDNLATVAERMEARGNQTDPADFGLPQPESITLTALDGLQLSGWYFDHPDPAGCGVVMLHGFGGARQHSLIYAPQLWARGCDLLMYDARHHGDSEGEFDTYGYYEKEDAVTAVEWLAERASLSHDQIGFQGVSYGAATSLQASALLPDIAFVMADSPYEDMVTIVSEQAVQQFGPWTLFFTPGAFAVAALRADFNPWAVSPITAVTQTDVPVFLTHSSTDAFTLPHHSEDIYAADPDDIDLVITEWGAAHAAAVYDDTERFEALVDAFLEEHKPDFGR